MRVPGLSKRSHYIAIGQFEASDSQDAQVTAEWMTKVLP
jgi:hypothetical protein